MPALSITRCSLMCLHNEVCNLMLSFYYLVSISYVISIVVFYPEKAKSSSSITYETHPGASSDMPSTRVVIVGAGAAGIAAASRLLENGISNIVILEAENRIGGRVYTTQFGNNVVDLGAQWVHGEKGNIISEMGQSLGLLGATRTEMIDSRFVNSSGVLISTDTTQKYLGLLLSILENSHESLKQFQGSLGEYLIKEYQKEATKLNINEVDKPYEKYFLDWFAKLENSIDGSDSWFYTSGPGHTIYRDCEGNLLQAWKTGGYNNIFDILMKKIPDPSKTLPVESKVQFNKEVAGIEWDNDETDQVLARCSDGTVYTGDYIMVTVSLGVLKEQAKSLFQPPLPNKKLVSIYGLSIGTVDKIYIRFPYQWWPDGSLGFSLIWTEEDERQFNQTHPSEGSRHWLTDVFGFYEVDHNPNVLCGWVVGRSARVMETLSDVEVTSGCMELLNRFLGHIYEIPHPDEVLRTQWSLNPHFRGSYSFRSMDSDAVRTYATDLAEPVTNSKGKQALLFAGEASHEHFFSTVHGAVESGFREADRVVQMIKNPVSSRL